MSEAPGYANDKCEVKISPKCRGKEAGYQRYLQYARVGKLLDACEPCARVPYDQPAQFQEVAQ